MIRSFRGKWAGSLFEGERPKGFPGELVAVARRKLRMLDASMSLVDLRCPPGNRLEPLLGDRQGQFSIRLNDQFRICFRWQEGDAHDVEIVDYH